MHRGDTIAVVMTALEGVERELAPADPAVMFGEVTAFAALVGADWTQGYRDEFISRASTELLDYPGQLALDGVARARKRVNAGRLLISWIADTVEPAMEKLEAERAHLTRLLEIANG